MASLGVVLAGQLRTLDWKARGFSLIEDVPEENLSAVLELVKAILEI